MKKLSKTEARKRIDNFFAQDNFDKEGVRKIKNMAMEFNIRLGKNRMRFCKKCYSNLKDGKTRLTKTHRTTVCPDCGFNNKALVG